jgi:lipoprotein signal peptidase
MAFRAQHPLERAGFALVVGGALGNIIDRLRQGAVTDFLDLLLARLALAHVQRRGYRHHAWARS